MFGEISPKLRTWFNVQPATSGQSLAADTTKPLGTKWVNNLLDPGSNGMLVRTAQNIVAAASLSANAVLSNTMYGHLANINAQSGTTYTLASSDTGKTVECSNASAITLTLPNSLAHGFSCTIVQTGAGQVTLSAAAGATLRSVDSFTKTAGQYAVLNIYVTTNAGGSSAVYILQGRGA